MTDWLKEREIGAGGTTLEALSGHNFWREILLGALPERTPESGKASFSDWLRLPKQHSFCLCGAAGVGKHTLAGAFAASMADRGKTVYYLREKDFSFRDPESRDVRIEELFEALTEEGAVLIQDNVTDSELWKRLTEEAAYLDEDCGAVVLFIESDEEILSLDPVSGILYCPLTNPDYDDRIAFFEESENRFPSNRKLTDDRKAEITAGFNYRELTTLVQFLKLSVMQETAAKYHSVTEAREQGFQKGNGPLGVTPARMKAIAEKVREPISVRRTNPAAQVQVMGLPANAVVMPEYTRQEMAEKNRSQQTAFQELESGGGVDQIDTTSMEGAAQAAFAELDNL